MSKRFTFSVIIPIYNSEEHLSEAVESVIGQTFGFENRIQIILVNEGNSDKTDEICREYERKHPNNIKYIHNKRQGSVSARSAGIDIAEGKYLNFLDADDKWTSDAFERAYGFFEDNYDEIDVLACRIRIFEPKDEYHFLDFKFDKDKIVDITKKYRMAQMSASSVFFKSKAIKEAGAAFNAHIGEDLSLVNGIILKKGRYGLLRSAEYLCRKATKDITASAGSYNHYDLYITEPDKIYSLIKEDCIQEYGEVIPYIQNLLANDIRLRLAYRRGRTDWLSEEEWCGFFEQMRKWLNLADSDIILKLRNVPMTDRVKMLKLTYGDSYEDSFDLSKVADRITILIDILDVRNGSLHIEGRSKIELLGDNWEVCIKDKAKREYALVTKKAPAYDSRMPDGSVMLPGTVFTADLPAEKENSYSFIIRDTFTGRTFTPAIKTLRHSRISEFPGSYFCFGDKIFFKSKNSIEVRKRTMILELKMKRSLDESIKKNGRADILHIRRNASKLRRGKTIWLLQDRADRAGDNAEVFFRYLQTTAAKDKYRIIFAVDESSCDYERLKKYGNVIAWGTDEYKALFLAADKYISSHWSYETTINPFGDDRKYVQDLITSDFIFLQHGIIMNDLSNFGYRNKTNLKMFVTAAEPEYRSIIDGEYGYSSKEVKKTGCARFDVLQSDPKGIVLFIPTWRRGLNNTDASGGGGDRYFDYYNRLISDERLTGCLKNHGLSGRIVPHPILMARNMQDRFKCNDVISMAENANYTELFKEGNLLVTDYSSVAMDFAYLKKPVIYTQFDKDAFFSNHTCTEGYFSYDENGFGPVCYDYESTLNTIIACLENGCVMEEKYIQRVEEFFAFTDNGNCERILNAIENL